MAYKFSLFSLSMLVLCAGAYAQKTETFGNSPNSIVFIGDSITALGNALATEQSESYGWGWTAQAVFLSGGRIEQLYNAGVPGQTSAQVEGRFATDVVSHNPATVNIMAGTDDATNPGFSSTNLASTVSNIKSMIDQAKAAGIQPVLCTIPPRNDAPNYNLNTQKINGALHKLAQAERILLVDFYSILVDPTTGGYKSGYALADGIHPSAAAAKAMAQFYVTATANLFGPAQESIAVTAGDGTNLIPNPLFLTSITAWTSNSYGSSPAPAFSVVTDPTISGNWLSVNFPPAKGVGESHSINGPTSTVIPGHHMAYSFKFQISGLQENGGFLNMGYAYGTANFTYGYLTDTAGTFYLEFTAPSNTFTPGFFLFPNPTSSNVLLKIAQISLVDLTELGF